jgi:predicted NBD/HSP70 family sugar kinase
MKRPSSTVDLRQNNRNRIFRFIYGEAEPITKQDIADSLSLSLPTVSSNLGELMEKGLIAYAGTKASTGGRKPRAITVDADARFAVGISVADNNAAFTAVDLKLGELAFRKTDMSFSCTSAYNNRLAAKLEAFLDENGLDRKKLLGVGISVPGIVRRSGDFIEFAPTLNIHRGRAVGIRGAIPYRTVLVNDATASGFAEWWCQTETENLAYLSLERGVGGAILLGGKSYAGDNSRSGEFGHICIVPGGKPCRCGRRGCLEAYCSASVISDDLGLTLDEFFAGLDRGDKELAAAWDEYTGHLAQGIVAIRAALDCDIVLGGALTAYLSEGRLSAFRTLVAGVDPFSGGGDYIRLGRFKSRSAGIGAALFFISDFVGGI